MQSHCSLHCCCLLDFIAFCPQGHSLAGAPGELTSATTTAGAGSTLPSSHPAAASTSAAALAPAPLSAFPPQVAVSSDLPVVILISSDSEGSCDGEGSSASVHHPTQKLSPLKSLTVNILHHYRQIRCTMGTVVFINKVFNLEALRIAAKLMFEENVLSKCRKY